jgi:NAD(P)-dependent dehydrogenase (short-subunit alcohol dehydrogenase family)
MGKKAIIVGGASGMARAAAVRLRERGAAVAIIDLPASGGERVAKSPEPVLNWSHRWDLW